MRWLDKLERRFGRFAIPNLMMIFIVGQGIAYALTLMFPATPAVLVFQRDMVIHHGELWRVISFMFMPPGANLIFIAFVLYFYYLMGTTLEAEWGEFRFNLYILIGYVLSLAAAFIAPGGIATNVYIFSSVFLAFAYLYPDFMIYLFLILPIRVKWLALITWLIYGYTIIFGTWMERLLVVASVGNFFVFFGRDILLGARSAKRRMEWDARTVSTPDAPFHTCAVCGLTDQADPHAEFRVCTDCSGDEEYCADHIDAHEHR